MKETDELEKRETYIQNERYTLRERHGLDLPKWY